LDKPIVATVKKARIEYVFTGILWTSNKRKKSAIVATTNENIFTLPLHFTQETSSLWTKKFHTNFKTWLMHSFLKELGCYLCLRNLKTEQKIYTIHRYFWELSKADAFLKLFCNPICCLLTEFLATSVHLHQSSSIQYQSLL